MTIAEVSKKYELTADTLRYYERIGLLPPVGRNKSGIRDYTEEDCNWVGFIKCMRNAGISIETLIEYVSLFQKGEGTIPARKNLLIEQRAHASHFTDHGINLVFNHLVDIGCLVFEFFGSVC